VPSGSNSTASARTATPRRTRERLTLRSRTTLVASLLVAALIAWIVSVQRNGGMDAGPGTDLGALGWFIGIWVTVMAATMLHSTMPTALMFARVRAGASTGAFVLGDLLPWTALGLAAYAIYRGLRDAERATPIAWRPQSRRRNRPWPRFAPGWVWTCQRS
jgi:hypothetical protein